MKVKVQSYMYDPMIKQFIENENENGIKKSEILPQPTKLNTLSLSKKYVISKIMIYWFEEEPFDDFYSQIKDLVIGNNVVPLYELAYKFSNKKEVNKSDNVW